MFIQIWQMRRSTCVLGCRRPMATGCPGRVTSSRSAASAAACAAATRSSRRASIAASTRVLTSLASLPASGRSAASSPPKPRRIAAREPFRPRYRIRTASAADTSAAAARSAWAAASREARACARSLIRPPQKRAPRMTRGAASRVAIRARLRPAPSPGPRGRRTPRRRAPPDRPGPSGQVRHPPCAARPSAGYRTARPFGPPR